MKAFLIAVCRPVKTEQWVDVRAYMMLSASVQRLSFSTKQGVDVAASTDRAYDFGHLSRNEAVTYVINVRGPREALY